jgi:hypothetical protein
MIGLTVIVVAAAAVLFALVQMNRTASVARLYTAGQFIVQSNIDTIQSDTPFVPQNSLIPAELKLGTTSSSGVPIYFDPNTGAVVASGTLTTTVSDISNTSNSANPQYAYQATVQLDYSYRSKNYEVMASTVRGSDQ